MKKTNKKILITGGAGFIGSNTAFYFSKKGWKIYLIDNLSRKGSENNLINLKTYYIHELLFTSQLHTFLLICLNFN